MNAIALGRMQLAMSLSPMNLTLGKTVIATYLQRKLCCNSGKVSVCVCGWILVEEEQIGVGNVSWKHWCIEHQQAQNNGMEVELMLKSWDLSSSKSYSLSMSSLEEESSCLVACQDASCFCCTV